MDALGKWLANQLQFVPDFPYRNAVLVLVLLSVSIGLLTTLWLLAGLFFRQTSSREKLEIADDMIRKGDLAGGKRLMVSIGAFSKAAKVSLRMGDKREAAQLASQGGDKLLAGQLLAAVGRHEEAGEAYEKGGKFSEAGEQWEKARRLEEALTCYRQAKNISRTESILRRMKRHKELADLLFGEFSRVMAGQGSNASPGLLERSRSLGGRAAEASQAAGDFRRGAEVYLQLGLYNEAASCLEKGGDLVGASDLCQQGGKLERGAELLIRAGRFEMAADLYEQLQQPEKIPELLERAGKPKEAKLFSAKLAMHQQTSPSKAGDLYVEAGEFSEAAQCYEEDGNWERAGEAWRSAGQLKEGAQAFEKAERWLEAAEAYLESADHGKAGTCFEKGGRLDRALTEYEKGGAFLDAGRLAAPIDVDRAIEFYQEISPSSKECPQADQALAQLFLKKNLLKEAGDKFLKIKNTVKFEKTNFDFFYDYASFLEATQKWKEAAQLFGRILTVDFHYRDVLHRKKELEERASRRGQVGSVADTTATVSSPAAAQTFVPQPSVLVGGRYELIRKIGGGGMGVVFQGEDRKLGRDVAVKFLPPAVDPERERRFLSEARIVAQLSHPNIVAVYDMGSINDYLYLVMEYVEGSDLKEWLNGQGDGYLDVAMAVRQVGQITDALAYAHQQKVVHRDIKSQNVLVGGGGTLKVADFGLARVIDRKDLTATQNIGSPLYMAPELIQGNRFDHRVDLYALGAIFYELVTGNPPFTEGEVTYHHVHTPVKPPREIREDLPGDIDGAILRLLAKDPAERFASAEEFQTALRSFSL